MSHKFKFCEEVLKFLRAEYQDSYKFEINYLEGLKETEIELKITSDGLTRVIKNSHMLYFYDSYRRGLFFKDRDQYQWQKELIDLIEGA